MPEIPGLKADVFFGSAADEQLPDWRKLVPDRDDEDDEDEPLSDAERAALVGILGFDPAQFDEPIQMSQSDSPHHDALGRFAAEANEAARSSPTGKFGDNKTFISHAHRAYAENKTKQGKIASDLDMFKRHLNKAREAGLVHLARADLPHLMDPKDVEESHTQIGHDRSASAHFIVHSDGLAMSQSGNPWKQYKGPRGGDGWKHSGTGDVRYQPDQPGAHETGPGDSSKEPKKSNSTQIPLHVGKSIDGKYEIPKALSFKAADVISSLPAEQKDQIASYTANGYKTLNKSMRQCPPEFQCLGGDDRSKIDAIESAIQSAGNFDEPITVYRGMSGSKELIESMKSHVGGDPVSLPSITSTSVDPAKAADFTSFSSYECMLHITAKSGLYVESLTKHKGEQEVLMSSKTKYRVVAVQTAIAVFERMPVIYLEEV